MLTVLAEQPVIENLATLPGAEAASATSPGNTIVSTKKALKRAHKARLYADFFKLITLLRISIVVYHFLQ